MELGWIVLSDVVFGLEVKPVLLSVVYHYRVRMGHGKPGKSEFLISFSRPGKSWNGSVGHGKSWKVMEK